MAGQSTLGDSISNLMVANGVLYATSSLSGGSYFYSYNKNLTVLSNPGANYWQSTKWYHIAGTYDSTTGIKLYVDGVETSTSGSGSMATNTLPLMIGTGLGGVGDSYNSTLSFGGLIDEVALYARTLSPAEAMDRYRRGALNIKFQVRSCDDPACAGDSFIGPDGSPATYYSEMQNFSNGVPLALSFSPVPLGNNQYFQYKAVLETSNTGISPKLLSVSIGPSR